MMQSLGIVVNISNGFTARKERRLRALEAALSQRGAQLHVFPTVRAGIAGAVIEAARKSACEALLSGGGDGTFNDLLQSVVIARSDLPIGVLPFGSGNILSQEVQPTANIDQIAERVLSATPRPIAIGKMTAHADGKDVTRYFGVAAGVGADARVICGIDPRHKRRFGIAAYYAEGARQLLFGRDLLPQFFVRFVDSNTGAPREERVTQVIAERVSYFGRCLTGRNGHGLRSEGFRLVLFKTTRRSVFLAYGAQLLLARYSPAARSIRDVEIAHTPELTFSAGEHSSAPVFAEVDGEPVGELPVKITLIPNAVRLLISEVSCASA